MSLFQILDTCTRDIGTCCTDYGIVAVLDITRKIFDLMQIFIPILLLIMATVNFIILITNPDAKNGKKKIINQFLAAIIIFFIPTMMNAVLNMLPNNFEIAACWQKAKVNAEIQRTLEPTFQYKPDDERTKILINPDDYEMGDKRAGSSGEGSAKGKAIVDYALTFVGRPYKLGGTWNGEEPYTATDCSGFVQGVFKHHGINLKRSSREQLKDTSSYTEISASEIQAGDLVMYDGHVAILTGNGNEIVHASSPTNGIIKTKSYKYRSIEKLVRINGVN